MKGLVIKSTGSWYDVQLEDGQIVPCRLKGKFRMDGLSSTNPVAVGDQVDLKLAAQEGGYIIDDILDRENYIVRQSPRKKNARHIIAANIDQAVLIVTFAHPRTSTGFIDRFLVSAEAYHIPSLLVFNKQDVFNEKEMAKQEKITQIYSSIGYKVLLTSAFETESLKVLKSELKGKTSLIAGHSGVGKSSLLNALIPGIELRTKEISKIHDKGTHTTTFAEMFDLPFGGKVIDTPGIKEFGVLDFELNELAGYYPEMRRIQDNCQFNNCLHQNEPKCAVKQAVEAGVLSQERYKNYLRILKDVAEASKNWS